eukprot:gene19770-biopygen28599
MPAFIPFPPIQQFRNVLKELPYVFDNQGCHMFLTAKKYSDLFDRIQAIHGADIRSNIVVCGEYCGKGVQSKVALCKLDKMFVIFAIRIDY